MSQHICYPSCNPLIMASCQPLADYETVRDLSPLCRLTRAPGQWQDPCQGMWALPSHTLDVGGPSGLPPPHTLPAELSRSPELIHMGGLSKLITLSLQPQISKLLGFLARLGPIVFPRSQTASVGLSGT